MNDEPQTLVEIVTEPDLRSILGELEPQSDLLRQPKEGQLVFKAMRLEHFCSFLQSGFWFNAVDSYRDFPNADPDDGEQTPADVAWSRNVRIGNLPLAATSLQDLYRQSRRRTLACCFSLRNTPDIWKYGDVCVVFHFDRLRTIVNESFRQWRLVRDNGKPFPQVFNLNYGLVDYVDRHEHTEFRSDAVKPVTLHGRPEIFGVFPNLLKYAYVKAKKYEVEEELRVTLSALPNFEILDGGRPVLFPSSLLLPFNFKEAIATGAVEQVMHSKDCDVTRLYAELRRVGIDPVDKP